MATEDLKDSIQTIAIVSIYILCGVGTVLYHEWYGPSPSSNPIYYYLGMVLRGWLWPGYWGMALKEWAFGF